MHRKSVLPLSLAALLLGACAQNPYYGEHANTARGATVGAAGGAVLGNVVAGGGKRTQGGLIGAAVGATIGGLIGRQMDQQEAQLRQQMADTGVEVQRQGDTIRLQAPEAITFDTAQAQVKPAFHGVLDRLAASLQQYPGTVIQVEGHTDSVGSAAYNQTLSENRARSVRSYLIQRGVAGERIDAIGYGLTRPVADNTTPAGRAQNRRVEILIVPQQPQAAPPPAPAGNPDGGSQPAYRPYGY